MNRTIVLPSFAPDQAAEQVDSALRQALAACDSARECAVLWFAEVQRRALYRELGHASLELYATQALGFSLNRYWQFKRLADDLDRLPVLREAVATGTIGWTKAQQVARVATTQTQVAWVAKAATTGRRELAREVQAARTAARRSADPGQLEMQPARTPEVAPPVTTISLRADALQLARFEALIEKARKLRVAGPGVDRVDLVLAGLEALLSAEPAGDEASEQTRPKHGHSPVQVVVHQCPDCAAATVVTGRGERPLAPAQVEALACDARVQEPGRPNRATIPPSVRAAVLARDRHRCATPGCRSTMFLEVHHVVSRLRGGSNRADNLVTLCSRCHAFAHEQRGTCAGACAGDAAPVGGL
ncbi:MAG: HNH endonuclease [bacterium]|nr:HNH endonuclease [bacterium]